MESQVDITFYDFTHRNVIEWINNEKLLYMKTTFKLVTTSHMNTVTPVSYLKISFMYVHIYLISSNPWYIVTAFSIFHFMNHFVSVNINAVRYLFTLQ